LLLSVLDSARRRLAFRSPSLASRVPSSSCASAPDDDASCGVAITLVREKVSATTMCATTHVTSRKRRRGALVGVIFALHHAWPSWARIRVDERRRVLHSTRVTHFPPPSNQKPKKKIFGSPKKRIKYQRIFQICICIVGLKKQDERNLVTPFSPPFPSFLPPSLHTHARAAAMTSSASPVGWALTALLLLASCASLAQAAVHQLCATTNPTDNSFVARQSAPGDVCACGASLPYALYERTTFAYTPYGRGRIRVLLPTSSSTLLVAILRISEKVNRESVVTL